MLENFIPTVSRDFPSSTGGKIFVNYSAGDELCPKRQKAKTIIQLSCGSTVGHPKVIR